MIPIKTVAVAGAGGTIGQPIVRTLLLSKRFDEVRVLTRTGATHGFPPEVSVREVDYASPASLEAALRDVDCVVSAMSFDAIDAQQNLVDAAAAAGVSRMIPSEYGNDTMNPKLATMPIYQPKIAIRERCQRKVLETGGKFSWTVVMNASFLAPDWTLDFLVDMLNLQCDIKDGGDVLFCATMFDDVARAILGIILHPEETANRPVKISSIDTTQNEILKMAQEICPDGWKITHSSTEDLEKQGRERWAKGDHSFEVQSMLINRAFLGKGWGGYFPEKDNELLGIKGISKQELGQVIEVALGRRSQTA
ncbi:hypothetical protein N0V93_004099 [Gnomoniopsis smithogilvyi]|uniref:NmrA-like domain-containing protein n=1 Tax=Gnomoniopsis smithogilvyi TaxID=1191159 RepID=A0A9W8YXX1_9PEZI|nr:hypothetical protein N0V93_004099 [Gnomoniopsis smithogilvyi]